jgi:hypothetical protein
LLKVIADLEGLGITAEKTAEKVERAIDILASAVSGIGGLVSKWGGEGAQGIGATISAIGGTIGALGAATAIGAGPMGWIALAISAIDTIFTAYDELVTKPAAAAAEEMAASLEAAVAAAQAVAASFWGVVSSSEEVAAIQEGLANTLTGILNELLGFLWPIVSIFDAIAALFSIEEKTVAEIVTSTQETLSNLNVPIGFPINRIRFRAATPGEPIVYKTPEEPQSPVEQMLTWWEIVMQDYSTEITEAIQPIKDFIDTMRALWVSLIPAVMSMVLPMLSTFGWTLGQISGWMTTVFKEDFETFAAGFATFWTEKVDPFWKNDLFPQITEWLDQIYGWLDAIISFFSTSGWDWLTTDVWGAIKPFVDTVLDMFEEFGTWVAANWPTIKDVLLAKLQTLLNGIVTNLGGWLTGIEAWLTGADLQKGFDPLTFALQFVTGLLNALGGVLAIGRVVFVLFFNLLGLLMNAIIAPVNAVLAAVNFALGWLGVHIAPIPYFAWTPLAAGGIAMSEMLAKIGEQGPEMVAPLSALPGIMSGVMRSMPIAYGQQLGAGNPLSPSAQYAGGGGGVTINVNVSQQRLVTVMMREMVSANVNDTGVGFAPVRI